MKRLLIALILAVISSTVMGATWTVTNSTLSSTLYANSPTTNDNGTSVYCVITNAYGTVTSSVVTLSVTNGSGGGGAGNMEWVTNTTLGSLANTYAGWVGCQFAIAATTNLQITDFGFYVTSSSSQVHGIILRNDDSNTVLATNYIATSGLSSGFHFVSLGSPVKLLGASASHYSLLVQSFSGGDNYYSGVDTTVSEDTSLATITFASYTATPTGTINTYGTSHDAFGPVSFKGALSP